MHFNNLPKKYDLSKAGVKISSSLTDTGFACSSCVMALRLLQDRERDDFSPAVCGTKRFTVI